MHTELRSSVGTLAAWVRRTDDRAADHLSLLGRAERILSGEEVARAGGRAELAEQLARWRYEHLAKRSGRLGAEDRRLAAALDLAENQLAGRDARPPRWPRAALEDGSHSQEHIAEAVACLDPDVPLEDLARRAAKLTLDNFAMPGTDRRRMLLYAPLYLSSHCINHCVYCGFRRPHDIPRRHLSAQEALRQAEILRGRGFRQILLVAGDFPGLTTTEYHAEIIRMLVARGVHPAVEIAPQTTASYAELAAAGACGVTLYQETYNEQLYALYHPRGSKTSYDWRLEGLERAAEAGMRRLGLGILLGLADPRDDLLAMVRHACYLQARFADHALAFSLPRIYVAPPGFKPPYPVDDDTFIRLYCALRMAFPDADLVLSTRELASLRGRLAGICITQMSAGSSTTPGGYEDGEKPSGGYEDGEKPSGGEQFPVSDRRTPAEVAAWLQAAGFEIAWEVPAR